MSDANFVWKQPSSQADLLARLADARDLAVPERERENLCACAHTEISRLKAKLAEAEHTLHTAGVCEIGARNPNVASYMNEWEQRTTKAEAALAAQAAEMNRALAEADMHRHDADSLAVKVAELETALAAAEQWASSHAQIVADGETGEGVGSCGTCRNHAIVTCESVCTLVWGAVEQRYLPCEVLGNGCRAWSAREVTP